MGKIICYSDNIDTDGIIPARYLNTADEKILAQHCMEDVDRDFHKKIQAGDILVAGWNFGCGSSREHAPIALRACGISAVIACSFARIFFRNAINIGLPILECPNFVLDAKSGDRVEVDYKQGMIKNITQNRVYAVPPYPDSIQAIIEHGGVMNWMKTQMQSSSEEICDIE